MKLIVSKPRAVAALVVGSAAISACASSQKQLTAPQQAAAQAEEQAQKAQNDAQKAREASDKTQKDLAEAQQSHNEARQAELMADQRATEASRRAAVAEAQAGLAAKPAAIPPASTQAQGAAQTSEKGEKGVAEAQGHEGGGKVKILTTSLLFKSGSAELMPSAKSQLDEVAQALSAQPQSNNVKVQGYTDSTGSAAINDPLSKKRAETVADYLESKGVPKDRITAEGFGKKDPVSTANTTEGHALNRRVDIVVEPVEGRAMPQAEPKQGQPQHGQPQQGHPQHGQPSQPPPSQQP